MVDTSLLLSLLSVDSPSGDEYRMADWLVDWIASHTPECTVVRLRDCLIVTRGSAPRAAVFAHIDTIGYTVAFDGNVFPIGHPATPKEGARVRMIGASNAVVGTLRPQKMDAWKVEGVDCAPGDRLVTADAPVIDEAAGTVTSPYLDNRGGVYAALEVLLGAKQVVVAFTTGEETGASGARLCARYIWEKLGLANALVSDITWHTKHVRCGKGVAISRRDATVPSQRYLDRILALAEGSEIPYQIEIESSGSSDGQGIEHSACPIDWLFVGAPEKRPHTPIEELSLSDLDAMSRMLIYLADHL